MTSTYYSEQWNTETIDQAAPQRYNRVPGNAPITPAAPVNVSVLQLHEDITHTWPAELGALPHQPDAAHQLQIIRAGITRARLILDGPEKPHHTLADAPPLRPMPPTEAAAWLGDTYGYKVTAHRVRVWASRGHLTPDDRGRYHPLDLTAVAARMCT